VALALLYRESNEKEVNDMRGFIVGALAGGVAAYLWRDQLNRYLDSRTRGIRTRAAETLKQAGEMVESAGERIAETIEAGQEGPSVRRARNTPAAR
jgi:hypothetical protein